MKKFHFSPARMKGFTLIELMVVIGIIAILAAVVLVAVNPLRQFQSARDSQRRSDLYALTNAMYQFSVENNGALPAGVPTGEANALEVGTAVGNLNLATDLVPTYIADIPSDPLDGTPEDTGYTIFQTAAGRLVASGTSELTGDFISVER